VKNTHSARKLAKPSPLQCRPSPVRIPSDSSRLMLFLSVTLGLFSQPSSNGPAQQKSVNSPSLYLQFTNMSRWACCILFLCVQQQPSHKINPHPTLFPHFLNALSGFDFPKERTTSGVMAYSTEDVSYADYLARIMVISE